MNRRGLLAFLGASVVAPARLAAAEALARFFPGAAGVASLDHAPFERLLTRYVRASADGVNRVNYAAWKASPADMAALNAYVGRLQLQDPRALTRAEQFAFWANLYNAETLRVVLSAYPVKSILMIHPILLSIGPWKKATLTVAGVSLSLDDMENRILRPLFGDARVHYALNCASFSCPNLNARPWRGDTLGRDLDGAAQAYVNHSRGARVTPDGLRLSSIYSWYRTDFGASSTSVIAHLRRYAREPLRASLGGSPKIVGYDYDWRLNDTTAAAR